MKKIFLIIILVLILIIVTVLAILPKTKKSNNANVKIPILLYHDFVATAPDSDTDNFNYINTPQSFEENIKVLLEMVILLFLFKNYMMQLMGKCLCLKSLS